MSAQTPILNVNSIGDPVVRRNFQNMLAYFLAEGQLDGFEAFEIVFPAAQANFLVNHGLGGIPSDLILTLLIGAGSFTINWGLCTTSQLNIAVTDACRVRFLVGALGAVTATQTFQKTDTQTFNPGG